MRLSDSAILAAWREKVTLNQPSGRMPVRVQQGGRSAASLKRAGDEPVYVSECGIVRDKRQSRQASCRSFSRGARLLTPGPARSRLSVRGGGDAQEVRHEEADVSRMGPFVLGRRGLCRGSRGSCARGDSRRQRLGDHHPVRERISDAHLGRGDVPDHPVRERVDHLRAGRDLLPDHAIRFRGDHPRIGRFPGDHREIREREHQPVLGRDDHDDHAVRIGLPASERREHIADLGVRIRISNADGRKRPVANPGPASAGERIEAGSPLIAAAADRSGLPARQGLTAPARLPRVGTPPGRIVQGLEKCGRASRRPPNARAPGPVNGPG